MPRTNLVNVQEMRTVVIVPTYNEIENIKDLCESILHCTPAEVDILVVDDKSPDGTGQLVDSIVKTEPRVNILHRQQKEGLGPAYLAGFAWALEKDYEAVIEMDADFSHHPKYLAVMLDLLTNYDVVIGSRYVPGGGTLNWKLKRKILSRGGSLYSRIILGAPIRDFTGGFNGWRRRALEGINLDTVKSDGYSFQIELKYRAFLKEFRITEFPIVFEDRQVGQSKMHGGIIIEALRRVWIFRLRKSAFLIESKDTPSGGGVDKTVSDKS